jgi:hypothetical protein
VRSRDEIVQVACRVVGRKIAACQGEIGGGVAIKPAEPLDLGRLEPTRVLPRPLEKLFELFPVAAMGGDEFVDGSQWTTPTALQRRNRSN